MKMRCRYSSMMIRKERRIKLEEEREEKRSRRGGMMKIEEGRNEGKGEGGRGGDLKWKWNELETLEDRSLSFEKSSHRTDVRTYG